jgi:hypothetical protein
MRDPGKSSSVWVVLAAVLAAALLVTGGVLALVKPAMLAGPQAAGNDAVRIFAGYIASRNLSIALVLLGGLLLRRQQLVAAALLLVGFVQYADALFDAIEGRWPIVPGVLLLGTLFLLAAAKSRRPSPYIPATAP